MSLHSIGKRLSDAFNALIAPAVIARLEMERDAAKQGYMILRNRHFIHMHKIDDAAAQVIIDRSNKRLEEWKPR